jgi:hypothetical protein
MTSAFDLDRALGQHRLLAEKNLNSQQKEYPIVLQYAAVSVVIGTPFGKDDDTTHNLSYVF